jgi:hypothetical protein
MASQNAREWDGVVDCFWAGAGTLARQGLDLYLAGMRRSEDALNAVAHGSTLAALEIGGEFSVGLGLSDRDVFVETILKYRLSG